MAEDVTTRYDRCRIEIDYRPQTVSPGALRPVLRLAFEFESQDDPLLLAILQRWREQYEATLAANGGVARLDMT